VEHFEDITGFLANKKMESMSEIEKNYIAQGGGLKAKA
jgi:hypothetical protein